MVDVTMGAPVQNGGFVPIPGYEGYAISKSGSVWSERSSRTLKPHISNGYPSVSLRSKNKDMHIRVHQLLAITFLGYDREVGHVVNHIDGNRLNSTLDNIEVTDQKGNIEHSIRSGIWNPATWQGIFNGGPSKPIQQLTRDFRVVADYPSAAEAERITGFSRKVISQVCKGLRPTYRNYRWRFA
jgi:hypothetical protein